MASSEFLSRQQYQYMARIAEQSHRYKDMMNYMNDLVRLLVPFGKELNAEERKLLSTAYKNVIGSLRSAWQIVSDAELNYKDGRKNGCNVQEYRTKLEDQISEVCSTILKLLDETLIPYTFSIESAVFYFKMRGDYQRYLAEFKVGYDREVAVEEATLSYKKAERIALDGLRRSHPMRLGLALNFSVFYYEILNASETARSTAEAAYDDALEDIISLPDELSKESTLILQLLRQNLTRWDVQNK